jgi:hypothetical protein
MAYKINSGTGLLPARIIGEEGQIERVGKSPGTAKRPMQRQEEPAWFTGKLFFGQQEPPPHWDMPHWQASPEEAATSPMTTRANIRAQKNAMVLKSGRRITLPIAYILIRYGKVKSVKSFSEKMDFKSIRPMLTVSGSAAGSWGGVPGI